MKRKGINFYCKIYKKILIQDLKSKLSYRTDFIISTFGILFTNILGFVSFWIIYNNFPSIMGWNYHEMLFLYGFSLITLTPVQCLFDNHWQLRHYVYSGDFIKYCFRPINIFFYFTSEIFDIKGLGQFAFGIGTLIYSWNMLSLPFSFWILLKLILAFLTSSLFIIALMILAAASCFWVINSGYIMVTVNKFKDYAKYPVTIFNTVFRLLFTFVIPIAFISYYPSLLFLRSHAIPLLTWLSPLIGILFFYISYVIWMKGAKTYSGTGS